MRTVVSLVFALALGAGAIVGLPRMCGEDTFDAWSASGGAQATCGDQYNALVAEAKAALSKGNQRAALRGLLAARSQLRSCEKRENDSATGAVAIALNSPRLDGSCR